MSDVARQAVIEEHLKTLKLPAFTRDYAARARQARELGELVGPDGERYNELLWDTAVRAPEFESGELTGWFLARCAVTDADGAPVPGASVSVESDQTLSRRMVLTDNSGKATAQGLDPARAVLGGAGPVANRILAGMAERRVADVMREAGRVRQQ